MSGTRPNKIPPETVTQDESANATHSDTEIEISDFHSGDTFTEFEIKVNQAYSKTGLIQGDEWTQVSNDVSESYIYDMCELNGKLYAVSALNGYLLEWNGTDSWIQRASTYPGMGGLYACCVFNNEIYAVGAYDAHLLKWNGTDAWIKVAHEYDPTYKSVNDLVILNNELYGIANNNGILLKFNGTDAWIKAADQFGTNDYTAKLIVLNGKIYGETYGGELLEWNGLDAWIEVAPQYGDEPWITDLEVHNNKIYAITGNDGGGSNYGNLLEWNGLDAWIQKAPQYGSCEYLRSLRSFKGELYAGQNNDGGLLHWNNINAWEEVTTKLSESHIISLIDFDNQLFAGTGVNALLYKWNSVYGPLSISPVASIGIDSNHEKYLSKSQCDLTQIGTYIIENTIPLESNETIKIYIDGDGATEGYLTGTVRFLDT